MTLDDISHAAHTGHLQGRILELEAKLREAEEARSLAGDRGRSLANCNGRPFALSEIVANLCHDFANAKAAKEDALEAYERVRLRAETAERERDEARERLRAVSRDRHALDHYGPWESCGWGNCPRDRAALGEKP